MNCVTCILVSLVITSIEVQSQDVSTGPIVSWSKSNANLLRGVRDINVVYNESYDPHCIWVFSGYYGSGQADTNFSCYNITSDTIQLRETLHTGGYTLSEPAAIIRDNIIYFWRRDDATIRTFDFVTKESTTPFLTVSQFDDPCLTMHLDGSQLYLLGLGDGDASSTDFYVYNFINDTSYFGPSLNNVRRRVSCVINQYYNDPYLYVLGGASIYIERLNLNKFDKWEQLTLNLDDIDGGDFTTSDHGNSGYFSIFSIDYYIYILSGYDGDDENSDEMYYLDVKNWELKYAGLSALQWWSTSTIYIERTQRVYAFGGVSVNPTTYRDDIYYSNKVIIPAVEPTDPPGIEPSNLPSNSPTNKPSVGPTTEPTDDPTNQPTTEPTDDPTGIPTDEPTHQPSDQPTDEPTIEPSDQPTDNPIDINIDDSNENSITPAPVEIIIGQTNAPTSQSGQSSDGANTSKNNNKNNNNDSNSLLIVVIVFGVLISCCCIIILCVLVLWMGVWTKRKDTDKKRGYNDEREMQNQLFATENQLLRNQVRLQYNNNNNNGGIRGIGTINYQQGTELQPLPNLQQARILSTSLMSSGVHGEINGEANAEVNAIGGSNSNVNRNRVRKGRIEKEMNNNNNNNNDDDLYLVNGNNSDLDIDIGGSDLSNINKSVATKINIDGKQVNITYQDLINALKNKDNGNNDTTVIAGENVDIDSD